MHAPEGLQARRVPGSATRSTGSTPTPSTSRTSTRAPTRCAPRGSTTTSRSPASSSGRAWTRAPDRRAHDAVRAAPAGRSTSSYLVNWNNKQAHGLPRLDANAYSSAYRSELLDDRSSARIRGKRKTDAAELIDAMEVAGTTDLRAHVGPPARAEASSARPRGPAAAARGRRAARVAARRRPAPGPDNDGVYEHADAIRIMDAWWPLWVQARVPPALGRQAFDRLTATVASTTRRTTTASTSARPTRTGWYGYVRKDLRTSLGRKVRGRYSRVYCGGGVGRKLPAALRRSLAAAVQVAARRESTAPAARRKAAATSGATTRPPAPDRRRHPAADPLDQPPDVPAGERGPGAVTSLTRGLGGLNLRVVSCANGARTRRCPARGRAAAPLPPPSRRPEPDPGRRCDRLEPLRHLDVRAGQPPGRLREVAAPGRALRLHGRRLLHRRARAGGGAAAAARGARRRARAAARPARRPGRGRTTSARGSAGRSRRGAVAAGAFERPQPLRRRPGARL